MPSRTLRHRNAARDDIRGLWVDNRESDKHKVGVLIEECDGALCGRIIWLKKPMAGGEPKRDQHNPDAALRERPLCGLKILTGFKPGKAPSWFSGYIYNPNDGRTFNSTIHVRGRRLDQGSRFRRRVALRQDRGVGAAAGTAGPLQLTSSARAAKALRVNGSPGPATP